MDAHGTLLTGHFPDPQNSPLWPGIEAMLLKASLDGVAMWPYDELWVAIDNGVVIGAVTARGLRGGTVEFLNIGGIRAREWTALIEAQICEWGRQNGATKAIAAGRKGWWSHIQTMGWRIVGKDGKRVLYEKELCE